MKPTEQERRQSSHNLPNGISWKIDPPKSASKYLANVTSRKQRRHDLMKLQSPPLSGALDKKLPPPAEWSRQYSMLG
jgi:hypothetical protein